MSRAVQEQVWIKWAPALGIVGVIVYYVLFLYRHALNIPYMDDVQDVLLFLTNVVRSTELTHTVELFFTQHNEHRTLASRLFYYLVYRTEGEISFRTLIFLANLALPLLLLMIYLAIRPYPRVLLVLLPVSLILFQLRIYEIAFWSMAAFAYMFVYVFAFASFLSLRDVNGVRFVAAVVFATLGTFTLASGQLIWLVGIMSLLHQALVLRRISLAYVAWWVCSALLILAVWRIGYESVHRMDSTWNDFVDAPLHYLSYFLVLLGNAASQSSVLLATGVGSAMLLVSGYSFFKVISRRDISLELFAAFIILSVLAMTLGRAPYSQVGYALTPRYGFPSVLLLAITIALLASHIPDRWRTLKVYLGITVLAVAYWVSSFQIYATYMQGMLDLVVKSYNRGHYWAIPLPIKESDFIVSEAVSLGIYTPPPRPHPQPDVAATGFRENQGSLLRQPK